MAKFDVEAALAASSAEGPRRFKMPGAVPAPRAKTDGESLPSPVQGFVTAMQGPTFGFLDELTGAVNAVGELATGGGLEGARRAYIERRDLIRDAERQFRKERPTLANLSALAASAPVMMARMRAAPVMMAAPGASAAAVPSIAGSMARAGALGAGYGAVTGAGTSEASTPRGVAADVVAGGLLGGLLGAGTAGVANVIGNLGRGARMQMAAGGPVSGGMLPQIEQMAASKIIQAVQRDQPRGTIFNGGRVPTGNLMASGAPELRAPVSNPLERMVARQQKLGPEAMVVDAGGENVRRLADVIVTLPGQTAEAMKRAKLARRAGSAERIMSAAETALAATSPASRKMIREAGGGYVGSMPALLDQMSAQRSVDAAPLYDKLHSMVVTLDEPTAKALSAAEQLGALPAGKRQAIAELRDFTLTPDMLKPGQQVSMKDLDYAARGLDSLIEKETDKVTGKVSSEGVTLNRLRQAIIDKLDNLTTDETGQSLFKAARSAWAGPTRVKEVAELGRKSLDADKNWRIADEIGGIGESEMDAFRIGVLQAVRDKAGGPAGRTQLLSYWENPNIGDKLKAAFGGNFRQFASSLMKEERLRGIQNIGGNSATASRLKGIEDLGEQAMQDAAAAGAAAKSGDALGVVSRVRSLLARMEMPEPVRDEIGRVLMMRGPAARERLLLLEKQLQNVARTQSARAGATGAGTGISVGRAVATQQPDNQ